MKHPASYVDLSKCDKCSSSRTLHDSVSHSVCNEMHLEDKKKKKVEWRCWAETSYTHVLCKCKSSSLKQDVRPWRQGKVCH